jgi:hypothetical protein
MGDRLKAILCACTDESGYDMMFSLRHYNVDGQHPTYLLHDYDNDLVYYSHEAFTLEEARHVHRVEGADHHRITVLGCPCRVFEGADNHLCQFPSEYKPGICEPNLEDKDWGCLPDDCPFRHTDGILMYAQEIKEKKDV